MSRSGIRRLVQRGHNDRTREAIRTVCYWQFSSGIQTGTRNLAPIINSAGKEALWGPKHNETQYTGQTRLDVSAFGASGTPVYNDGVALIPFTDLGLKAEFSAAGAWFR